MAWNVLWVALGGAIGSSSRYLAGLAMAAWLGESWPWATLAVNLLGCLAMGALAGLAEGVPVHPAVKLALATGVLGGFTTFSAFGLETWTLAGRSGPSAIAYVMITCIGCLSTTGIGLFATRWVVQA